MQLVLFALGCGVDLVFPPFPPVVTTIPPSDLDGDGFSDLEDCAPEDPLRFPGAPERCNLLDDDCDGALDQWIDQDFDADGFPWCTDCLDSDATVYPGAVDPYGDWLDQNCDGTDGIGMAVSGAVREGAVAYQVSGWWLASGDLDQDGCDDLVIGEPGYWGVVGEQGLRAPDQVAVSDGCHPWFEPVVVPGGSGEPPGSSSLFGFRVEVGGPFVLVHELGFHGRGHLYAGTSFASPVLGVQGTGGFDVDDATLLGSEWLLVGRGEWIDWPAGFRAVSTSRTGIVDFETDAADHELFTNGRGGRVANIGDRDGDGQVDLGVSLVTGSVASANLFPQVLTAHTDDAPEIWDHGGVYEGSVGGILHGAADLDGDGRDDAWMASTLADGVNGITYGGKVHIMPHRGFGRFQYEVDAVATIVGEQTFDETGFATATGDLDGDGATDLVVGAGGNEQLTGHPGKVSVYLGPLSGTYDLQDAALVWVGEAPDDHLGGSVTVGDFDGSGFPDIAVGAPFADTEGGVNAGRVYVLLDPLAPD